MTGFTKTLKNNFIEFKESITIKSVVKYTIIVLLIAIIMISNIYSGYFINNPFREKGIGQCYNVPILNEYIGLADVLHQNIKSQNVKDIAKNIANAVFITNILALFILFMPYNVTNMKILLSFLIIAALAYIIRVASFSVTVPPPPHQQTELEKKKWYDIPKIILEETNPSAPLSDFMFSGHAFFIVLSFLFIWYFRKINWLHFYSPKLFNVLLILIGIASVCSLPAISISGLHYTSDVIIGVSIAILFFLSKQYFVLDINYKALL